MTILFVGHHSSGLNDKGEDTIVYSAAGDLVQKNIFRYLLKISHASIFFTMQPCRAWPRGPLFMNSVKKTNGIFSGNITLPLVRHLVFAIKLASYICKVKPSKVICYNNYFFESAVIIFFSKIFKYKSVIILQDIRAGGDFALHHRFSDYIASTLVKYFDVSVVVSKYMQSYLRLDTRLIKHNSLVFPGGVSDFGQNARLYDKPTEDFAVFAGSLEKHNGIDLLINTWINSDIKIDLHVFGSGRLSNFVAEMSSNHDNIHYHGFTSQEIVFDWQVKAKFNFCFRLSDGIDQEFFFPSKFFNSVMCPGLLIFNNFLNVPEDLKVSEGYIGNDFSLIKIIVENNKKFIDTFDIRTYIENEYSWDKLLKSVLLD
ncbi:hypothetical protein [Shewanella sp. TB4-MNA-CIBAN-0142]|uniref:hypothetical protein n=1 Tax=Shewanella sp. TB4-MNA-CIBAN-0142 TaxID=3140464 RepID=UPI00331E1168